jgi:hypothetical protein
VAAGASEAGVAKVETEAHRCASPADAAHQAQGTQAAVHQAQLAYDAPLPAAGILPESVGADPKSPGQA